MEKSEVKRVFERHADQIWRLMAEAPEAERPPVWDDWAGQKEDQIAGNMIDWALTTLFQHYLNG